MDGEGCPAKAVKCCLCCCFVVCVHWPVNYPICCCFLVVIIAALTLLPVLTAAGYVSFTDVRITVDEASLGRLALAAPGTGTGTGTGTGSLACDLSVAVAVRNPNWGIAVWRTAPLDDQLRFHGQKSGRARLAGAEWGRRIGALRQDVYRVTAAAESAPVALDGDDVAEFVKESIAGVFELELTVAGEFKYQTHHGRRSLRVVCPLKLSLSKATTAAAFARVKCTEACLHSSASP